MAKIIIIIEFQELRERLEQPFNFQVANKWVLKLKLGFLQRFTDHIGNVSRLSKDKCKHRSKFCVYSHLILDTYCTPL